MDDLDPIFKALANRVRRGMLDLLRERPMTTGELVMEFPDLSRYAVMQHLGVLTEAGLVVSEREGRLRFNYLNAVPLRRMYERWVSKYEDQWASALTALKDTVERGGSRSLAPDKHRRPERAAKKETS